MKIEQVEQPSTARRTAYFLFLMFLVSTLNMADRQIIGVLAEPLKHAFGMSDTMLGLLGGTAFALVYPPLGLPIARLADRFSRRTILAICLAVWSMAAALCGAATGIATLLLARMGVAAGEAGYAPATHALIAETVSPRHRTLAFAVLVTGISAGGFLTSALGGYVAQHYGWRWAFVTIGLPGLAVALLVATTVREPPRLMAPVASTAFAVYRRLLANRAFSWCVAGSSLHLIVSYGLGAWAIPFFLRQHHLTLAQAGLMLGGVGAIAGALGSVLGGITGDWLARRDRRWLGWWPAITVAIAALVGAPAFLIGDLRLAVAGVAAAVFLNALYQPSTYALIQGVARPGERASAAALMIFAQNLVGLGLGPVLIGLLSDQLTPSFGARSLGVAIAGVFVFNLFAPVAYWRAAAALDPAGDD